MKLKEQNLRFALLKFVADAINDELAGQRTDHLEVLTEHYQDTGAKSLDVRLPNGVKVATISLTAPTAKTEVVDEDAFLAWCQENMPTAVDTETIPATPGYWVPATPEKTVHKVKPEMRAALLKTVTPVDATGGPVVDGNGLLVDGVVHTPSGQPKSFSVRGTDGGPEATILAWRAGELADIVQSPTLPAIEPSNVIPMHGWVDDLSDAPVPFELDEKAEAVVYNDDDDARDFAWPPMRPGASA